MNIPESTSSLYLQLGIAGATLLILLVFIVLLFKYVTKDNKRVDKLCEKIDLLVTSLTAVTVANDKDQKVTIKLLTDIMAATLDTQRRVVRIDDRTFKCLGKPNEKE